MRKTVVRLASLFGIVCVVGCGGSHDSATSGQSRVSLYVTDSFREDYAHVWATIYHVELVPQTGANVVVYDDPAGKLIDLKTLRDSSGTRFSFLSNATIPDGTYNGATVSVGTTMQLMRNGVAVGDPLAVDSTLPLDTSGHPVLSLTFASPKTISGTSNTLIIDFDLARFVVRNSKVLPVIADGSTNGCTDPARHNEDDYRGTASAISGTSPDVTFTLTQANGKTVIVVTSASTAVYGTGTLAAGSKVGVSGTVDSTTGNLVATRLEVLPTAAPEVQQAAGAASTIDPTAGTFILTVARAKGFTPAQTTVTVTTSNTTVYRADGGSTITQSEFFTALAATPAAVVAGTYDSATNTLAATSLKVEDASQNGGWERGHRRFRQGVNEGNWGHGVTH